MIKFFRKIRQNLLAQNKISKYFFYAIGEIILVVIGILIALQINNWNDQSNKKEDEKQIILEIISDLKESKSRLIEISNDNTGKIPRNVESMKLVENYLMNEPIYNDSMTAHFTDCFSFWNINYKETGYETLKSLGFNIIENQNIRKDIGLYFTQIVPQSYSQFDIVKTEHYNYMIDYCKTHFNTIITEDSNGAKAQHIPVDYANLKQNKEFIQAVKMYRYVVQIYLDNLKASLDETNKLIATLEEYTRSNF